MRRIRSGTTGKAPGARRVRRTWWAVGALAAAACAGLLLAGGGDPGPRPLSVDEAERMALARFRTYRVSPSEITLRAASGDGSAVVRAVVDHRRHRAVGWYEVTGAGRPGGGLLAWDQSGLAVADGSPTPPTEGALRAAGRLKPTAWTRRAFGAAPLDTALRLALSLGADRPDNAQLLAQSGPLRLRDERVDGRRYDVFSGPRPRPNASASSSARSPLSYWVDDEGGLRRVRADLGEGRTITMDLGGVRMRGVSSLPGAPWGER
ncbi:hypothetical protein ACOT81_45195 [Streptomyces sp. WI04-05B]|uniref:hypothetical protein n=1 Tax=Streptomyces TaxID=1883 RepID=UPI0029B65B21|nr:MULTISPECIES: hypothetical protein [unclassified Streptomyces]MDX2543455.1 hypothetical protein [Streptomyces sp. WI04-05B]MDX2589124.1 hypothetical protein [Streptomyces sp. WI04-05A]MDX3746627.1 hypothetical protein [Streptomyces sp. AK08-02]